MEIRNLFLSAGHNYFGHHGKDPGEHPIVEVSSVECIAGLGIRGDRFFGYRPNYKGQITFFAWEVFVAMQQALELPRAAVCALRRNVITEGVELTSLVGREFEVQGVSFFGVEECRPCYWMDRAFISGAETWLKGQGGLRAQIRSNGVLSTQNLPLNREAAQATVQFAAWMEDKKQTNIALQTSTV